MKMNRLIGLGGGFLLAVLVVLGVKGTFDLQIKQETTSHGPSPAIEDQKEEEERKTLKAIELIDLIGEETTGSAERALKDDKITYQIKGYLEKPKKDQFYQAWLVRGKPGEPDFDYFLIGRLKEKDEFFTLEFTKELDFLEYQSILITLEKVDDNIPETHILKGQF